VLNIADDTIYPTTRCPIGNESWPSQTAVKRGKATLVPVTLPAALMRNGGPHNHAELKILLPGKMSVAVGDNFSPATLNRLLTVLENR